MLYNLIHNLINFCVILLVFRALCSWFPNIRDSKIYGICFKITEPMVAPIRNLIYKSPYFRNMSIDFSIIFTVLILWMFDNMMFKLLYTGL